MGTNRKILLSGIQPTGRPHIGNYFGMMKQCIDMQEQYDCNIFIADLHALTQIQDRNELSENILNIAIDFLAIGLDPKKTIFYKQSDAPQVTELSWIFSCLMPIPQLMLTHAFKSIVAKNHISKIDNIDEYFENKSKAGFSKYNDVIEGAFSGIKVGLSTYPLLMAADIVISDADVVPIGQDQKQHLEIARDMVQKFNFKFGETFKLPTGVVMEDVATVPGTDGKKMSKSYKNTIPLFATDEEIRKAVMSIPTDSKGVDEAKDVETDKVFALHKLFTKGSELDDVRNRYNTGGIGYKESKDILVKNIQGFITPLREKRAQIAKDPEAVIKILKEGGAKARMRAEIKMEIVRRNIGVSI